MRLEIHKIDGTIFFKAGGIVTGFTVTKTYLQNLILETISRILCMI